MSAFDHHIQRLSVLCLVIIGGLLYGLSCSTPISAQAYPTKPIRLVVPYTPGGPTDYVARAIAQRLQKRYIQQVIVDNRAGGAGVIGTDIVAKSNPDGHTLFVGTPGQLVILPLLMTNLPYQPLIDFMPISKVVDSPQVLIINAKLPINTVSELVTYAKQRPGQLNYASVQTGGTGHLGMELLKQLGGIDLLHVTYKGTAPALTDLISGRVHAMFSSLPTVQPHVQGGRLRLLATGAKQRTDAIKDTPTLNETYPGFDLGTWYGLFAPRRTPTPIVPQLHRAIVEIVSSSDIAQLYASQGVEPAHTTPQELEAIIRNETNRWRKVIQTAGIKLE